MPSRSRPIEWPTVMLIAANYLALAAVLYFHAALPWWLVSALGACCVALHASLQHEVIHGHPTGSRRLNEAMVYLAPHLWLPYRRYRDSHLVHHNDAHLTDPSRDPESFYLLPEAWSAMPGVKRTLYRLNNTLAGRMLMGPAISILRIWSSDFAAIAAGDRAIGRAWAGFAAASALVVWFVVWVCAMPLWQYLALVAYPGIALALVRSFCEHQAAEKAEHRTIIVEASPFWSLLFLNNNLHVAHHARPGLAWYRIPAYYRAERSALIAGNNGYLMRGYGEIFRRYFLRAKEPVAYPDTGWLQAGEAS
jgi:fatty acid desaturase